MSCTCVSPTSTLNAAGTETGAAVDAVAVAAACVAADADVAAVEAAATVGAAAAAAAAVGADAAAPGAQLRGAACGMAADDSVGADAGALLGRLAAGNVLAAALAGTEGAAGALAAAPSLLDEAATAGASVPAGDGFCGDTGCCGGKVGPSAGISALHVGQTCCMTSHERRQSMWNIWPHGNFFGFEPSNNESLQMTQCSCCSISSSDASGKRISMLREMRR